MKHATLGGFLGAALTAASSAVAVTIAEINGNRFVSPLNGKDVTNVTGLVTASNENGIWLRALQPDNDTRTSEGLYVFGKTILGSVKVGDIISLNGHVEMYRSNKNYIQLTELSRPTNVVVRSSGNRVEPLVIALDTLSPPTQDYSGLDVGGIFGVPNAVNLVSTSNPILDPSKYGLDFWQSLLGELVTVKGAYQTSRPNNFGDVWVRGDWNTTGVNSHGGITMLEGDANPETIIIGSPLDGSKNPNNTKLGDYIGDVTGVVYNAFGFYRLLPLTAVAVATPASTEFPPVAFSSTGNCRGITVASYNAENLAPDSAHLPLVVDQIVHKLRLPDLIFLQEVQDDSGPTNNGVTSARLTLTTLTDALFRESGVGYNFTGVDPVNNQDGGQVGGNIRQVYLYRSDIVQLYNPNQGGSTDANEVLDGPALKYNPGRIDPSNQAYANSRKPLAAQWKTLKGGKPFFTVNVHMGSKGGSSTLHGDQRPPLNNGVDKRTSQNEAAAAFIADILAKDPKARVIAAGDFNEFSQVQPMRVFAAKSGLTNMDDIVSTPPEERYSYLFDMNCQTLDHMYASQALRKNAKFEHLHLNTWQDNAGQVSDHDPSVALFNVCGCA
ncbi:endonuclease/exonuclease/phosphatase family protein [Cordyceps fumosorosea ARSEF 2679]|uniref:Endonuclease/exonuclease/phosphatase family protein n=1 Tax=Cordyceps fumosorosea (strain ARSEF 2679) TaxID=1081104 RepID=A0A168BLZ8_CORFA|nr:endonuclease/exonuclease/phosphatase family protein [Cordyceps fumosorosea ARSEF 2679]OAA70293.1 endonuclease/exonuclease/phosphatase family protein [Cordyceps fumosorosea ARSEF 2679]